MLGKNLKYAIKLNIMKEEKKNVIKKKINEKLLPLLYINNKLTSRRT